MKKQSLGVAVVLGAVVLSLAGVRANAQVGAQEYRGEFTLDQQVRWGQSVLDPGQYTVVLHSAERGSIATIRGEHKTIMVMANAAADDAAPKASSLMLIGDSRSRSVRSLHLAEFGVNLYYPVGKREMELEARNAQDASSVPLVFSGK